MRRIKSAPANICLMTNNKKSLNEKIIRLFELNHEK